MGNAAVAAAKAVGYVGAGTVEFLLDQDQQFFFLEMNTRLQVEHPVTELVTGLDLVRAQLTVAAGEGLPWHQEEIKARGHALECRIYAEDPARDFLPSLGPILLLREPGGPGIRIDSGVRECDEVSMHYDPMIAKLCIHGSDREAAIDRAIQALRSYAVLGITTNIDYLMEILAHPEFRRGATHTGFLPEFFPRWKRDHRDEEIPALVAVGIEELLRGGTLTQQETQGSSTWATPWEQLGHFRLRGLS
jgi:acetyl/propionyl-CoA carboxylase alpha subunit